MRGFRYIATAVVASAVSFAIASATGWGHGERTARFLTARPGDGVTFAGLDLFCNVERSDPDHVEAGPVMYCNRYSVKGDSRAMGASRYHYYVTNATGDRITFKVSRAP
jgi:hypothetical protein